MFYIRLFACLPVFVVPEEDQIIDGHPGSRDRREQTHRA